MRLAYIILLSYITFSRHSKAATVRVSETNCSSNNVCSNFVSIPKSTRSTRWHHSDRSHKILHRPLNILHSSLGCTCNCVLSSEHCSEGRPIQPTQAQALFIERFRPKEHKAIMRTWEDFWRRKEGDLKDLCTLPSLRLRLAKAACFMALVNLLASPWRKRYLLVPRSDNFSAIRLASRIFSWHLVLGC